MLMQIDMNKINDIRINIEPANEEILEFILLTRLTHQTDQEKYEIIKPVADKLNFFCDIHSIRCIDDCNYLAIKIKKIHFVHYDRESNMFMMLMKKNPNLHILNINAKEHTIYVNKEHHNFIASFFLKMSDRIWLLYTKCSMNIHLLFREKIEKLF